MRRMLLLALLGSLVIAGSAQARGLAPPAAVSPGNGARVQQFPAISWNGVRGASQYEYQVAADSRFNSIVLGTGPGKGTSRTHNLAAALEKNLADGTYYWRVRGVSAKDKPGAWSRVRRVIKAWTAAPIITSGNGAAVAWPRSPLVLRWSSVAYATKYIVTIATDPALSNIVVGSATQPVETQGTNFALPVSLAEGAYYWAVTPLDSDGHRGVRSATAGFRWTWPSSTATSVTDLNPDPAVFDPMFSWNPVLGAARYEVEVNSAEGFPAGSRWCCSTTTTGTSLAPLQVLANNAYFWRVRAIDARGNAGVWNSGQPFTKAFDSVEPSVANLVVRNSGGTALNGIPETGVPIVTWDPVSGASRYEVQLAPYGGLGCDWSFAAINPTVYQADTATTAWTPLGQAGRIGPTAWPQPQRSKALPVGVTYCVRVLARSDNDAQGGQVVSDWTQVNGANNPAFVYTAPPPAGPPAAPFVTPAGAYIQPASGLVTPRTPWFTWNRVSGANGYYVVIARDAGFTQVDDIGFTNVPAYAPRIASGTPLSDETTSYYWAAIPTTGSEGTGVFDDVPQDNSPHSFNKSSTAPQPISPANLAEVSTQPSFYWTPAENARNYHLQVSQDPTFGKPIDDVSTDATAYTSSSTYPADTVIYWRVRANDWNGQGLNWSPTREFVRRLPAPVPNPMASGGPAIPPLTWSAVTGAVSYDLHLEEPDGKSKDTSFEAPSASVVKYYGTGIWRWRVRAEFPTATGGRVPGGYSAPQPDLVTLPPPTGARGVKSGSRLQISWHPEPYAKQYDVELSTSSGFSSRIESHKLDGTSWAPNIDLTRKQNRGTLYWRLAAVDWGGNVGSFTSGTFGSPPRRCVSSPRRGTRKAPRCAKKRTGKPHK